jgi:hypothetical protein
VTGAVPFDRERIQDEVERQLMAHEHFNAARRYILYRQARAQQRDGRRLRIRIRATGRPSSRPPWCV